ncbi:MAG: hypothetical protein M1817_002196 [Caeruleum heppii]|nr:MAG: hypothetical protein M1817_002196 [Caeruleum heppii]
MADPTNKQRALLEKLLASPFTLDRIVPYLQRCSHIETARFFLRHLARSDLNPLKSSPANIDYFLVEKTFEGLAKERKGDAVYFTILEALHHHRRPIGDIARQLLGLLRGLSRLKEHASTIQHLMNSSVSVSPDMLAAELSRISRSDAALAFAILRDQQMSSRGRALLACCEDLMVALVDNPGLHPDDLFTLVKRDRQLLSRSPPARVRLVNRMASGFAHAAHLNPRVAFRYVYGCYAFLKRTSSPLTANISRALTHAAITRPLLEGQWVSTMKLRFVLGVVRQLEGGKVADDLDEIVFGWRGAIVSTPEYRQRAQRMAREATDGG